MLDLRNQQGLPRRATAEFILGARRGSVLALAGIDGESLRALLDQVEPEACCRRALFVRIAPAPTTEAIVEHVTNHFADAARSLWPIWFTDVSFGECRNDRLGRLAAGVIARRAAGEIAGLSPYWAEAAARLALDDRPPRVRAKLAAIELAQLALAISRSGLVLVADAGAVARMGSPAAVVHALEWIAQHLHGAVVALFPELPRNEPPFERILYGARRVTADAGAEPGVIEHDPIGTADARTWIAPWRGLPHPLSE